MSLNHKIRKPTRKQSKMIECNESQLKAYLECQEFICYDR